MKMPQLRSAGDLRALVNEVGMIPLFRGPVPGFSVEELTAEGYWFSDEVEGPWNWRMELAASREIAYARLFRGKYGFVSPEMYPHLANYRREGYDFDARVDEGLVRDGEKRLYALIEDGMNLSMELRRAFNGKGFESALTGLQMRAYVTCSGFERRRNRKGEPYGWEIARYETAEAVFGARCSAAYDAEPEESLEIIRKKLSGYIPAESVDMLLGM